MYITEEYRTAQGWRNRGFILKEGARHHRRNSNGVAVFARSQVRRRWSYYE